MTGILLRNRQRIQPVDLALLRKIVRTLLCELAPTPAFELGVYLVAPDEMTRINETYLQHGGSTDVISFHYPDDHVLRGELFISMADAIEQAQRFKTTWQSEIIRYIVHGVLHLKGFDDLTPGERRTMKRHENQLLQQLGQRFPLHQLQPARSEPSKRRPPPPRHR